jgi:hypothetical protein
MPLPAEKGDSLKKGTALLVLVLAAVAASFTLAPAGYGADFGIDRIGLYFGNNRAESTTVEDTGGYGAYADIRFTGSGLLQGYWEVDGRTLSPVSRHLVSGGTVTVRTPESPGLPTFDPGTHTVRFVVMSPTVAMPLPTILYFVVPRSAAYRSLPLKTLAPADGAVVRYSRPLLSWEKGKGSTLYLVVFYGGRESRPLFSAYTREESYTLPEEVLGPVFAAGKKYYWKVIGFDARNSVVTSTGLKSFYLDNN